MKNLKLKITIPFLSIEGVVWEANETQRDAAWEMYVELVTRVSAVELPEEEGILRESLTSLYKIFQLTREILRKYGPNVARPYKGSEMTFGRLAVFILNKILSPILTKWHPLLSDWEHQRKPNCSLVQHEKDWPKNNELRNEINRVRRELIGCVKVLEVIANISDLTISKQHTDQNISIERIK